MRPSTALLLSTTTAVTAFSFSSLYQRATNLQIPFSSPSKMTSSPTSHLSISDVLPQTRSINIFAGLTRDIDPISDRLDSPSQNSTILAPLNSAIQALDRKPWEDEDEIQAFSGSQAGAYGLGDGEQRANDNLRRFVERHIVPVSPWAEKEKVKTLAGDEVWWESRGEDMVVMPSEVKVGNVASKVGNGEVWVLEGVLRKK